MTFKKIDECAKSLSKLATGKINAHVGETNSVNYEYLINSTPDESIKADIRELFEQYGISKKNHTLENTKDLYIFPKKIENDKKDLIANLKTKLSIKQNIYFKIGQPNTGKSHSFKEKILFPDGENGKDYIYYKEMVEGGFVGLTSQDITIGLSPQKEPFITKFLEILMSSIINPNIPHIIYFDDFHNTDISILLSPYMGLLKQNYDISEIDKNILKNVLTVDDWNIIINEIRKSNKNIDNFQITDKFTNHSIQLFMPNNFFILGAANWNKNSLNIFDDIKERAHIENIKVINENLDLTKNNEIGDANLKIYIKLLNEINKKYANILEEYNIFDIDKYGIGIWRVNKAIDFTKIDEIKSDLIQVFGLIGTSLINNNKKNSIKEIGFELIKAIKDEEFKLDSNFKYTVKEIFKILDTEFDNTFDENDKNISKKLNEFGFIVK